MRKLLIIALSILLFSCEKSGFEFSSARLILNKVDDAETLDFSISLSNEENGYMLSISSREDLLRWEERKDRSLMARVAGTPFILTIRS